MTTDSPPRRSRCPDCDGDGYASTDHHLPPDGVPCARCHGAGDLLETETERAERIRREFAAGGLADPAQQADAAAVKRLLALKGLAAREAEFAASLREQVLRQERRLSQAQRRWLDSILGRATR